MTTKVDLKFKHLAAWDQMMGSAAYWCEGMQQKARDEKAPIDAIYFREGEGWHRYSDVSNEGTKRIITGIFQSRGWGNP